MENEFNSYEIGNEELEMPRNWIDVEELRSYAEEFGFQDSNDLEGVLESSGIDVQNGKADFNQVHLILLTKGVISTPFLSMILESKFGIDEYYNISDLIKLLQQMFQLEPTDKEVDMVVSALKALAL